MTVSADSRFSWTWSRSHSSGTSFFSPPVSAFPLLCCLSDADESLSVLVLLLSSFCPSNVMFLFGRSAGALRSASMDCQVVNYGQSGRCGSVSHSTRCFKQRGSQTGAAAAGGSIVRRYKTSQDWSSPVILPANFTCLFCWAIMRSTTKRFYLSLFTTYNTTLYYSIEHVGTR